MRRVPFKTLLFGLLIICSGITALSQKNVLTAKAIVDKMIEQYYKCSSYQDTGTVNTIWDDETGGRLTKMPFKTFFTRPEYLYFEWTDYSTFKNGRKKAIWYDGKQAYTYWEPDRFEKEDGWELAIAGAVGVSSGASTNIPSILLKDDMGTNLTRMKSLTLLGEDTFEGEICYHISGKPLPDLTYDVWISKNDFLLRKLKQESKDSDSHTITEEIHRNIKLNSDIPLSTYNFKPGIKLTEREAVSKAPKSGDVLEEERPDWRDFSPDKKFRILMPGESAAQTITTDIEGYHIEDQLFTAAKGSVVCIVMYADLPKEVITPEAIRILFDSSRDTFLQSSQSILKDEQRITLNDGPGREFTGEFPSAKVHCRMYVVAQRFYFMAIVIRTKDADAGYLKKFFDSFKVLNTKDTVSIPPINF